MFMGVYEPFNQKSVNFHKQRAPYRYKFCCFLFIHEHLNLFEGETKKAYEADVF